MLALSSDRGLPCRQGRAGQRGPPQTLGRAVDPTFSLSVGKLEEMGRGRAAPDDELPALGRSVCGAGGGRAGARGVVCAEACRRGCSSSCRVPGFCSRDSPGLITELQPAGVRPCSRSRGEGETSHHLSASWDRCSQTTCPSLILPRPAVAGLVYIPRRL